MIYKYKLCVSLTKTIYLTKALFEYIFNQIGNRLHRILKFIVTKKKKIDCYGASI